jgi:superfamily II DNA or RNA helicase
MKLIKRQPEIGYLDTWLWLPKRFVSERQIQSSLTYPWKDGVVEAWEEEPHHYRVPRNYFFGDLATLPFPIRDGRHTAFPKVRFKSHISLDALNAPHTFQEDGSRALLNCYDGILCLRCGAGKTVVALHSAAQLGHPILIIVGDKGLAKQWIEDIEKVLHIPEKNVGRIGGDGSPFVWKRKISIAIVNTLARRAEEHALPYAMTRHFGVIIGDEAHTLGAPFFNKAVPPFHGRRWGLSATPTREDGLDSLLRYTMGEVRFTHLMPEIPVEVVFKVLPTVLRAGKSDVYDATHDVSGELHLGMLYNYFGEENPDGRIDRIAEEIQKAVASGRQVLVLSHSRSTVEALGKRIPEAGLCHGDVGEDERFRRIRTMNPVICIMRLGKHALNKPSLDTLFICEPFRKPGTLQQTMGRIQRTMAGKRRALVVLFEDRSIPRIYRMCNRLRLTLRRWPSNKGGSIPYTVVGTP